MQEKEKQKLNSSLFKNRFWFNIYDIKSFLCVDTCNKL